jgi:homoaconitate hydratase family protein
MVQKIFSRAAGEKVRPGQYIDAEPDWAFGLDECVGGCSHYLKEAGIARVKYPKRIALFFDHFSPANNAHHATLQAQGRAFAKQQGIHAVYEVGEGIAHQLGVEYGIVKPGQIAVNIDSHTVTLGAVGCLGMGLGTSEMGFVWATGSIWFRVPESVRIELVGRLKPPVAAKDVILTLLGAHGARFAGYKAIEYAGNAIPHLSIAERMTLCNMGVEMGGKAALMPEDAVTRAHYKNLGITLDGPMLSADADAVYAKSVRLDLGSVEPVVACPHVVDNVKPIGQVKGTRIHQAFLGTCTNGRYEDLEAAARVLKGKRIADGVRMIVTPASKGAFSRALKSGVLETLIEAGCIVATPGCGACAGLHQGALGDGEVCIASSSRNFLGRMGNRESFVYLGSPATVAASAVAGTIADPREMV